VRALSRLKACRELFLFPDDFCPAHFTAKNTNSGDTEELSMNILCIFCQKRLKTWKNGCILKRYIYEKNKKLYGVDDE
jgi:hypothetical protein